MTRQFGYEWLSRWFILLTIFAGNTQALEFTTQPSDTSISDGSVSVVLDCSVNDGSDVSWFKDNRAITEDFVKYTFTSAGLRIKPVVKSDAGKYYCTTLDGKKSNVASLTVEYICKDKFKIKYPDVVFRAGNATLTCDCPSVPTPAYTWQKDGNVLATTGKTLVITNAQKARDDGEYVCVVNSGGKKATSLPHRLNILNCSPAKIANPPNRKTPFAIDKPLTVTCDATGDPQPVVTWSNYDSGRAMKNTSRIHILPSGALHFTKMKSDDVGQYKCTAYNGCHYNATAKTKLVVARIGTFPTIEDVLSRVGGTVSMTCVPPSDSLPPLKNITWLLGDGNPLPTDPRFKVVGNTLQIEKAQRADSGQYKCVGENIAGKGEIAVNVTVAIYPQVTKDPTDKTVNEGEPLKMECEFSGSPQPSITWEKDTESLSEDGNTRITSAGDASVLTIKNVVVDNAGSYRCVARLKHITERTKEATLSVKEKVVLLKIGSDKFDVGKDLKLKCIIDAGEAPFTYRWTRNGKNSIKYPRMKVQNSTLVIDKVEMSDTANYTCHVANLFSNASVTFNVHIYKYAKIVLKPRDVAVMENGTALFDCAASGDPNPGIGWYYRREKNSNFRPIPDKDPRIKQLPNNSLLLSNVQKEDEAWYRCLAGNAGNLDPATAYLKVGLETIPTTPILTVWSPFSTTERAGDKDEHDAGDMGKTVGIAVGCAGAYIILVVGLMIYCKGRRARQQKNKLIVNGEDVPLKPTDNLDNVEVVKAPGASKAKEYPRENLETLRTLGSGAYGAVFLAKASKISDDEAHSVVVVQSLTSGDEAVKTDFMRRMELLSLKHENIAKLLGVCQEDDPMYLISEYPEQGDLKTVMRDSSSPLNPTQKLNICAAVASGMNYLTNHGHVHKDLAARNCLVNKAFDVKISFLSLNQGTYPKEYYDHNGELIPLRWMAPEAIEGNYSDMSDVWAYGVLMWEVYSEGMLPYEERPDKEVLYSVADDLRLTKPEGCPGKIYKMMEKCWADDKEDRLTFGQLCEDLSEMPREIDF